MTGDEDTAPGPRVSADQAIAAPNGILRTVSRCGHYVPLERPECLNSILQEVIAGAL